VDVCFQHAAEEVQSMSEKASFRGVGTPISVFLLLSLVSMSRFHADRVERWVASAVGVG
jgi:hypothetical protein